MATTGFVKRWFGEKGFGFIVPADGGPDVMIHINEVAGTIKPYQGMPVQYQAAWDGAKGKLKATLLVCGNAGPQGGSAGWDPTGSATNDNLFVAGLPLDMTDDWMRQVFGQYGAIASCKVLPANGKPDCAAMLRMSDKSMAVWLVDNLNGNIPMGLQTPVTVKYAQSQGRGGKGGGGGSYGPAAGGAADYRSAPYSTPMADGMTAAAPMDAFAASLDAADPMASALLQEPPQHLLEMPDPQMEQHLQQVLV